VQIVLPSGRVAGGADALREIVRRIPRLRPAASILGLPGIRRVADLAYRRIAVMIVAGLTVHWKNGFFLQNHGFGYNAVILGRKPKMLPKS